MFDQRASQLEAHQLQCVVYVSTHVFEFPINIILALIRNNYYEQGNIIITNLLLPLGHISNSLPLALESIIQFTSPCDFNESNTHIVLGSDHVLLVREVLVNGSESFRSVCALQIFMSSYRCCYYVLFGNTPNIYSTIRIRFTTHSHSDQCQSLHRRNPLRRTL